MRRALVTGAASGIGRAIAARLEADGARVLAADLKPARDGPGEPIEADLTTREGNRAVVDASLDRFGRLDASSPTPASSTSRPLRPSTRTLGRLIALLLTSPFLLAKYAWEALREAGDARFIAIASVHGWSPRPSSWDTSRPSTA